MLTKRKVDRTKEELEKLKGVFSADVERESKVVLINDVFKSGAAMRECGTVLKKAGVEQVWGFTLARTV